MVKHIIKSFLFGFCILLTCFSSFSQDSSDQTFKQLDSMANKMFVDMNNRDYEAILNMTHPKVFDIMPKESMKEVFKSMFEGNEEFSIDIPRIVPNYKLSQVFKNDDDNLEYAFVSYDMNMKMTFHEQEFDEESKQMMIPMMKAQGMDVEFISNNTMKILMKGRITIILKDDSTNNKWVMLNYDPDSPLFYQVTPIHLMENAKQYKQDLMLESKRNSEN